MITILDKTQCCGCSACYNICPQKAIAMVEDEEGFSYPRVDASKCIQCGLCEKKCPEKPIPLESRTKTVAFAAYSLGQESRMSSSSGGVFPLLAEVVLASGGLVYGAAFDEEFRVHHICVSSSADLVKLQGSKYVQSNLESIFSEVKQALEQGKKVLFSGVICQIAGLKTFLGKDYPNLLTVDVLCHGVPSPKVWRKYLTEQETQKGGAVRKVCFRAKKNGWKNYSVQMVFANGSSFDQVYHNNPYMQLFLKNICLRPSCHHCMFNGIERVSDITIGDCWGIGGIIPEMDDDRGTSIILLHSSIGNEFFEKIKEKMVTREGDVDVLFPPESGGRISAKEHPKRKKFFKELDKKNLDELVKMVQPSLAKRLMTMARRISRISV